jgi:hypothetical protein
MAKHKPNLIDFLREDVRDDGRFDDILAGWCKPPAKAGTAQAQINGAPVAENSHEFVVKKTK